MTELSEEALEVWVCFPFLGTHKYEARSKGKVNPHIGYVGGGPDGHQVHVQLEMDEDETRNLAEAQKNAEARAQNRFQNA